MPPTLPRAICTKLGIVGIVGILAGGCRHVVSDPPTRPGPPIPAEPDADLANMDTECAGLIAALDLYGQCPNLESGDREWTRSAIEAAEDSFAAGKKAHPDEPSQKAIAAACHRATLSIRDATERCRAGKRPKVDY